jgi:hypothetical protein
MKLRAMPIRILAITLVAGLLSCSGGAPGASTSSPRATAHACAIAVSCDAQPGFAFNGAQCAQELLTKQLVGDSELVLDPSVFVRFARCASSATSCEAALACASMNHGPSYCSTHSSRTCDGDVLVSCLPISGWAVASIDCAATGQRCVMQPSGPMCSTSATCDPGGMARCDGDVLVRCLGGLESRFACGEYIPNGRCGTTDSGLVTCIGPGPSCAELSSRCDGNEIVYCPGDHEARVDCGLFDGRCVSEGTPSFSRCPPPDAECSEQSSDRCAGASLEICVNGHYVATPCASIGMTRCVTNAAGARCE